MFSIAAKPKKTWALSALLAGWIASPAVAAQGEEPSADSAAETVTLSCDALADASPESPVQWLTYSLRASHCYSFQARAVAIDTFNVRTLALSHRINDGVRQQVVQHLDGPSVNVERRAPMGHWGWLDASAVLEQDDKQQASADAAPMPRRWAEHVASIYTIELEQDSRVADRDAVQLTFTPKQDERYRHQWWLDKQTGLLLKHVLRDADGSILETFQVTRLQTPRRYQGDARAMRPENSAEPEWQVGWLPDGMVRQPSAVSDTPDGRTRQLYSDGLATVSVFVESPIVSTTLATGVHRLGVSAIAVERHQGSTPWQVIAIGEVPPEVLGRIARSVTHRPESDE